MNQIESARKWFLKTALAYLGTPYIWGGDDPSGFDCSGFVIECLKSAGILEEHQDYTANGLMRLFISKFVDAPYEGTLLFTLDVSGHATHVVICLDRYFQIGAAGGTHTTRDVDQAWRDNAYVKIRPLAFQGKRTVIVDPFRKEFPGEF